MSLDFSPGITKNEVFANIRSELAFHNLTIINDETRPWGGFFVIDELQASKFIETYFPVLDKSDVQAKNNCYRKQWAAGLRIKGVVFEFPAASIHLSRSQKLFT